MKNVTNVISNNQKEPIKSAKSFLTNDALQAMLYKLKKYYNELNSHKNEKLKKLSIVKENLAEYEKKIITLENFKDIEFEKEIISIKNISTFNESKEEIKAKIDKLNQEKKQITTKYLNEIEYTNVLNNLISCEKEKNKISHESYVQNMDEIKSIKAYKKNLDYNNENFKKREKDLDFIEKNLNREIKNLDGVLNDQKSQVNKLDYNIKKLKKLNADLKTENEKINSMREEELREEKTNILLKIQETSEMKKNKISEDSERIRWILGIDIINKYYLQKDSEGIKIDNKDLEKSQDLIIFKSKLYNVYGIDNTTVILNTNSSEQEGQQNTHSSRKNIHSSEFMKIYLKDVKNKFDNLVINYDHLYNFYSKIINKTFFYKTNINNINAQIIKLENLKERNTKLVREIIRSNYENFVLMSETNPIFRNYDRAYQEEIKKETSTKTANFIIKDLNLYFFNAQILKSEFKDFYAKCSEFISRTTAFSENINKYFEFFSEEFKKIENSLVDDFKKTQDILKTLILDSNKSHKILSKEKYILDIIQTSLTYNDEWRSKFEAQHNFSIENLRDTILSPAIKELFFSIKFPFEKSIFYFLVDLESSKSAFLNIFQNLDKMTKFLNIRNKGENDSKFEDIEDSTKSLPKNFINRNKSTETKIKAKKKEESQENDNSYYSIENSPGIGNNKRKEKAAKKLNSRKVSDSNSAPTAFSSTAIVKTNQFSEFKISERLSHLNEDKPQFRKFLNEHISEIKKNSRVSAEICHEISKKRHFIENMARDIVLFKNPSKNY
jgi:hypothetical protein